MVRLGGARLCCFSRFLVDKSNNQEARSATETGREAIDSIDIALKCLEWSDRPIVFEMSLYNKTDSASVDWYKINPSP
jgi:hypothetical protein